MRIFKNKKFVNTPTFIAWEAISSFKKPVIPLKLFLNVQNISVEKQKADYDKINSLDYNQPSVQLMFKHMKF